MMDIRSAVIRMPVLVLGYLAAMPFSSVAQITSTGYASRAETSYEIEYPDKKSRDNIYVFCNENGNLSASFPDEPGVLNFEWSVYENTIPGYYRSFKTDSGEASQITDIGSGGYQVRIRQGDRLDTLFRAWIFVNNPSASIEVRRHDCQVMDLLGIIDTEIFIHYHPLTNSEYSLPEEFNFDWTSDPSIPLQSNLDLRIWDPPAKKTNYTLSVVYHSCEAVATITEDPVTTRADFNVNPLDGEAPLEVQFDAGISLNAVEYEWYFNYIPDDTDTGIPASSITDPLYTYYIPGEYNVMLRTTSADFCEDTLVYPEPVRVYPSELEVPNVFTPGGDQHNDVFMVKAVSLKEFRAIIYNRNGRKVYEWTDPSEGWDGKTDGNNDASQGVYFYVITGLGWDDVEYEFTGSLYLFRAR